MQKRSNGGKLFMKLLFILGVYSIIILLVTSAICLQDGDKDMKAGAYLLLPILVYIIVSMKNIFY